MSVAITLISNNVAGGSGSDTVETAEYTDYTAAVSAIADGFLEVTTPNDGGKARSINVSHIRQIVSL